jgi:hypothetical protein
LIRRDEAEDVGADHRCWCGSSLDCRAYSDIGSARASRRQARPSGRSQMLTRGVPWAYHPAYSIASRGASQDRSVEGSTRA